MKENAIIKAVKNKEGFIELSLTIGDLDNVSIKVNDYGGTQKKTAQKLSFKIYKKVGA